MLTHKGVRDSYRPNGKMKKHGEQYLGAIAHSEEHFDELMDKWSKGLMKFPPIEKMTEVIGQVKADALEYAQDVALVTNPKPKLVSENSHRKVWPVGSYETFCEQGNKGQAVRIALAQKHNCPIEVIEGIITEHKSGRNDSGYAMWQEWIAA